jgi:stage II sporulation protein D
VELLSTQPTEDSRVLAIAAGILKADEEQIGWNATEAVRLQIYPTLDAYRNSTGQPGWVAASTKGRTIRVQPLKELEKRGILESTIRHEVLHVLVEARAAAKTPLWFREGIVLVLSNESAQGSATPEMTDGQIEAVLRQPTNRQEVQKAYAAAARRVSALMQQYGKEAVLGWLSDGIPRDISSAVASEPASTNH